MSTNSPERIPVTLIGGYLGAGKTSLLSHLLTHAGGERIAVLVNDFGVLGLDAALVARRDGDTVTLTNGCVCCSIADDFGTALDAQVRSSEPPERIVVETSGVAEPGKTARYASGWPGVRLDAVLTVVDLETIRTRARDRFVGDLVVRQIAAADLIVANKSDRVDAPARRATAAWLGRHATRAALVETSHGRVAPALVLGSGMSEPDRRPPGTENREVRSRRTDEPAASTREAPGSSDRDRNTHAPIGGESHPPFVRVTFRTREPFDRARLTAALDALPATVARFKGLVRLREHGDRSYLLQGVGRRWSLEAAPSYVAAALGVDNDSVIDFIGVGPEHAVQAAVGRIAPSAQCG